MKIGSYEITQFDDIFIIIRKKDKITLYLSDFEIASVIGTTSLEEFQIETEKWNEIKINTLDDSMKMFIRFMRYSGKWIVSRNQTESMFVKNKSYWYATKRFELLAAIVGLLMTKRKTVIETI
jgi:hypothetical protein